MASSFYQKNQVKLDTISKLIFAFGIIQTKPLLWALYEKNCHTSII